MSSLGHIGLCNGVVYGMGSGISYWDDCVGSLDKIVTSSLITTYTVDGVRAI